METARRLGFFAAGVLIAALIVGPIAMTLDDESMRLALRVSGRLSFMLWLATFIAAPLHHAWKTFASKFLLANRRSFGLMFGGAHFFHAILLVVYARAIPNAHFETYVIIGGGLGFLFVAGMTITSFEGPARAVGYAGWWLLHTLGTWYISSIFAIDFILTPIFQGRALEVNYLVWALLLASAYALRFRRTYLGWKKFSPPAAAQN